MDWFVKFLALLSDENSVLSPVERQNPISAPSPSTKDATQRAPSEARRTPQKKQDKPPSIDKTPNIGIVPVEKVVDMSKTGVTVKRLFQKYDAIISEVSINGVFECYALEDAKRDEKIWGETCIPDGRYKTTLKTWGGFHDRHKKHKAYNGLYRGMLWLRKVSMFEYILFHKGNWRGNTHGCVLLGKSFKEIFYQKTNRMEMWLNNSSGAYYPFYKKVVDDAANDNLEVEIVYAKQFVIEK